MCLGVPMRVLEVNGAFAVCEGRDATERRNVSLALVDGEGVLVGTRLLIHGDTAIRTLDDDEALLLEQALLGLDAANEGRPFDVFFADLLSREPELPPHLRTKTHP